MQQGECKLEVVVTKYNFCYEIFFQQEICNVYTCDRFTAALVALSPSESVPPPVADRKFYDSEDELPVTSYRCQ